METPPLGKTNPGHDVDRLRERLLILVTGCPRSAANPPTCPLYHIRELEPSEVIDWIDQLDTNQKQFLAQYHDCCLAIHWQRDWMEQLARATRPDGTQA